MKRVHPVRVAVCMLILAATAVLPARTARAETTILNVSYDPTRELYKAVDAVRRTASGRRIDVLLDSQPMPIGIDVDEGTVAAGERIGLSLDRVATQPSAAKA